MVRAKASRTAGTGDEHGIAARPGCVTRWRRERKAWRHRQCNPRCAAAGRRERCTACSAFGQRSLCAGKQCSQAHGRWRTVVACARAVGPYRPQRTFHQPLQIEHQIVAAFPAVSARRASAMAARVSAATATCATCAGDGKYVRNRGRIAGSDANGFQPSITAPGRFARRCR